MRSTVGIAALLSGVVLLSLAAEPALAAGRVALVVGNGAYEHTPALRNPANDAADVAAALAGLGFAVIEGRDLDREAFEAKLREFARAARGAEAALFFYAGHGIQVEGENFLLPVDARLSEELDLDFEALELRAFLRQMRGRANLVFLDACRDNPLAQDLARSMGASRSAAIGRGLGRVDAGSGTLIAYATQPGNVAADGTGRNSPFTAALLRHIAVPGRSVNDLLTAVTGDVAAATDNRQQPWTHSSLRAPFYFAAPEAAPVAVPAAPAATTSPPAGGANGTARLTAEQLAAERLFWESVKDSDDPADLEAYRSRYPGGTYEALAVNRLERLRRAAEEPAGQIVASAAQDPADATAEPGLRPDPETAEAALNLSRADRRLIQAGLESLGFDPGPADGLFGRKTRRALSAWQAAKGEPATGWLTAAEAGVLKAAGEEALRALADAERAAREAEARGEAERKAEAEREARARADAERKAREEAEREAQAEAERARQRREALRPGRVFRDCEACPEMVVVPAGSFVMGSPASEEGRFDNEGPQHRVTISRPLAVGRYEVTRGEFARFVSATGRSTGGSCWAKENGEWEERAGFGWRSPGYRQTDRDPAVCVNWDDARAYARWLSRETGQGYRLLSESEWEYAVRAGTRSSRWWGDGEAGQCAHANGVDRDLKRRYSDWRWTVASCSDGHVHTAPAGSFSANGFGLHDMSGNVWEWVEDCWHDSYAGAPSDGRAWTTGGNCSRRVIRGGSWIIGSRDLRSAIRYRYDTGNRIYDSGFRVARTLAP